MSARTATEVVERFTAKQVGVSSSVQHAVNANAARLGYVCRVVESQLRTSPAFQRMQEQHDAAVACARRKFEHALAELDAQIAADDLAAAQVETIPDIAAVRACSICGCTDERACDDLITGPCSWVSDDVCSGCVEEDVLA